MYNNIGLLIIICIFIIRLNLRIHRSSVDKLLVSLDNHPWVNDCNQPLLSHYYHSNLPRNMPTLAYKLGPKLNSVGANLAHGWSRHIFLRGIFNCSFTKFKVCKNLNLKLAKTTILIPKKKKLNHIWQCIRTWGFSFN